MAKKKGGAIAVKAAKKVKTAQKDEDDEQDLEAILEKMRRDWEESHAVVEELVGGPPSRRANATLTACPSGSHIWCIGGELFGDDGKAHFYNDVFRYSPDKDDWRKYVSPTCPGPRSAHAVAASPIGGGKLFLFGGEFSSLYQNSFHHYRDFWCFDIATRSWDRIETKIRPSARSGHRMALWKHCIVLFGGFYDPGVTTRYLNDLWVFDIHDYKWSKIEFKDADRKPSPRSGFSFLSAPDGILLHGGYCKEYVKGKRPVGVMLDDTWFLSMSLSTSSEGSSSKNFNPLTVKWERRKRPSTAYAPSLRSGCTMTLWASKGMGVMFGGVTDEDTSEETMESVFHQDLNAYQISNGKWSSMLLKRPKKKRAAARKKKPFSAPAEINSDDEKWEVGSGDEDDVKKTTSKTSPVELPPNPDTEIEAIDPDDPILSTPPPRYNTMLAVLRNTLYMYAHMAVFSSADRASTRWTTFYALPLDKMDRYLCLKQSDIFVPAEGEESSSDGSDSESDEDDEGGSRSGEEINVDEETVVPAEAHKEISLEEEEDTIRQKAKAFMGVDLMTASRSPEDILGTPIPGETLAAFYARSREHWAQQARTTSDNRGKSLRRDGFSLAEERYAGYKPILDEVEKILAEAGLDEEEMKRGALGAEADGGGGVPQSRNRR
ncbi:hypothetical protein EW146_g10287 [Bondarzewia mesenterica]|uniref:DUF4110 domain-containing protein n=1 Tax=Bondarzewia mesenterica TaxID=1095465 RepID=A0A4S4L3E9_9AGAM|nr:hypothetical protein EW146_g10287 [Bondarzewia mesenterica]